MTESIRMKLQNSEPIKPCTECKHCESNCIGIFDEQSTCKISLSVVTSRPALCVEVRSNPALCGLGGTHWEPKE